MKTFLSVIYKMICHFSIAFSGIILFFWSFMRESGYINYDRLSVFAIFALIFGISSVIFAIPKLPDVLKIALHFIVNTIGFLSTFVSVDGVTQAQAFISGAFFVIVYIVVFALSLLLKKLACKSKSVKEDGTDSNV